MLLFERSGLTNSGRYAGATQRTALPAADLDAYLRTMLLRRVFLGERRTTWARRVYLLQWEFAPNAWAEGELTGVVDDFEETARRIAESVRFEVDRRFTMPMQLREPPVQLQVVSLSRRLGSTGRGAAIACARPGDPQPTDRPWHA